jgi:hypothetical protein
MDNFFWLNYYRKYYILPKPPRCVGGNLWCFGRNLWQLQYGRSNFMVKLVLLTSATWRRFPPAFLNAQNIIWPEKAQMSAGETHTHSLEFLARKVRENNISTKNPFGHHKFLRLKYYKFKLPVGSYRETCTSFYVFLGPKKLSGWVGYWTLTQLHHFLSASHRPTPPPWQHYL